MGVSPNVSAGFQMTAGIIPNAHQICINACSQCSVACYECLTACLNEPDLAARKNCVGMLVECAMMCQSSVAMMSMDGRFSKQHCQVCAQVCDKCAQECAMFKDAHCQKCAEVCRACAGECRKMAGM